MKFFYYLILFFLCVCPGIAKEPLRIEGNWQILDQEQVNGVASILENPEEYAWKPVDLRKRKFVSSKEGEYFLLRSKLPATQLWKSPSVFLGKSIFSYTVWHDTKMVYQHSDHTQFHAKRFLGWLWHQFTIQEKAQPSYLYLKVYSELNLHLPISELGDENYLYNRTFMQSLPAMFVAVICVFLGIIFLIVSILLKDMFNVSITIFYLCVGWWLININPISQFLLALNPLRLQLELFALYLAPIGCVLLVMEIVPSRLNHVLRVCAYIFFAYFLVAALAEFSGLLPLWKTVIPFDIYLLCAILLVSYQIIRGSLRGNSKARILAFGLVALIFFATHDAFVVMGHLQHNMQMHWGALSFILSMVGIALARTIEMHRELATKNKSLDFLNQNLETKVQERTYELSESMKKIQTLKEQQDGDYFLTSLLEKPLQTNRNKSKKVQTDFYTSQKKKFEFMNRKAELGGDISISGNLRFFQEGKRYIFFFNGDAMGKSMQGAGGAIVAGTAVNNIIARSARNNKVIQVSPEIWLKETYQELDAIFQTFGGSMVMSAVCGIVDEETGEMWFFNAEHPATILFRDGKAHFIDSGIELRKLGSPINVDFEFLRYQLLPGDILFCGSDGRDDLEISHTKGSNRKINEDETLILRIVEQSQGEIQTILRLLEETGSITDDLSLVKLSFQTNALVDQGL
ncbi:MAG: SpoIIE family protein phosphatase [Spirochaetota bacterium]